MIRHHKKYTTGEKMTIRKLFNEGKTDKEIGEAIGRKPKSLQMQRSKMGVTKFKRKAAHKQSRIQAKPLNLEDLRAALPVLKALGYELTITKIGE